MPGEADIKVQRGNDCPMAWRFKYQGVVIDLTGSEFVLRIEWPRGVIRLSSADGGLVMDAPNGLVYWYSTPAQTRQIPLGLVARYELERRISGKQRTWMMGGVEGVGGTNDDG